MGSNTPSHDMPGSGAANTPVRLTLYTEPDASARWRAAGLESSVLIVRRTDGSDAPQFAAGTPVQLSWQDPLERVVLELTALVADCHGSEVRLQLQGIPDHALAKVRGLLGESAQSAATSGSRAATPSPIVGDSNRYLKAVTHCLRDGLRERIQSLFEHAELGLQHVAGEESIDVAGMPVKLAAEQISAHRSAIVNEFVLQSERGFLGGLSSRPRRSPGLRLVDDEEMQVWLSRSESARVLERDSRAAWHRLLPVLREAAHGRAEVDPDALGVEALLDALVHACKSAGIEPALQQLLMRLAGRAETLDLKGLFEKLRVELHRLGLSADAIRAKPSGRDPDRTPAPPRGPNTGRPGPRPVEAASPVRDTTAAAVRAAVDTGSPAAETFEHIGPDANTAIEATRRIWAWGHQAGAEQGAETGAELSDEVLLAGVKSVFAEIDEGVDGAGFRKQLQARTQALSEQQQLKPSQRQTEALELVGRLQQAIEVDPLLPRKFSGWSRSLLPPILGTQLRPEGLGDSGETLRRLFALLEFGSVLCAERDDAQTADIGQQIEQVVTELSTLPALLPEHIDSASTRLESLLQRHRKAGGAIEERVIEACVGQQRLVDARRIVNGELDLLFGGRRVPKALWLLLDERVNALLVLTVLRHGEQGEDWLRSLAHLQRLDAALRSAAEGTPSVDPDALLAWIPELFSQGAAELVALDQQITELRRCLGGNNVEWIAYPSDAPKSANAAVELLPNPDADDLLQRMGLLQPNEWLAFDADQQEPRLLKLAWHAPDRQRFVFVSQLGHKAEDYTNVELWQALRDGRVRILDEGRSSVVERAWRRMVEGLHDELAEQVVRDPLTGLFNRKELDRRLLRWINARQRPSLGLMWIGIDHVRVLNQSFGMGAGDDALRQVGWIIKDLTGRRSKEGYGVRIAGDEFVLVVPDCQLAEAEQMAQQLLEQVEKLDLHWEGRPFRVSISVGLCIADESCASADSLLKDAEQACRAAKESGRGRVYLHKADDFRLSEMRESVSWVGRVEQALEQGSLVLFGQHAMSLSARAKAEPDYMEILLRMRTPEGMASPEHFIVAAERYGQITSIDRFVMQELCRALRGLDGSCRFRVGFNISARNMVDPAFIDEIIETLSEQPIPMNQLCIELTETAAIQQIADACNGMQRLSAAGLSMVLDDFGSGWSSYQYLRRLPFDIVKVDGAFIRDIATSAEDLALARSINEVAHMLGKRTVAEHIENQETLDLVREIGFDYAQGFFMARPVPLSDLLHPGA